MLPKKYRLTGKKDFETVFKTGQGRHAKILGIKFTKSNLENSRFGFIVSKKVSPKAVVRNKIKRQAREIIQSHLSNIKNGLDVVIICHSGITDKNYQEIEKEILQIAEKIGLISYKKL